MIKKLVKVQNIVIALAVLGLAIYIAKHSTYINSGVEVPADSTIVKSDSVVKDTIK